MSGSPFGILEAKSSEKASEAQVEAADKATKAQLEMFYTSRADQAPWIRTGAGALGALWGAPGTPETKTGGYWTGGTTGGQQLKIIGYHTEMGDTGPISVPTYGLETVPAAGGTWVPEKVTPATTGTTGLIQKGPGQFIPEEEPGYKFGYKEFVENPLLRGAAATGKLGSGATLKALTRYASDYASTKYDNFLDRYYKSLDPYMRLAGLGSNVAVSGGNQSGNASQGIAASTLAAGAGQAAGYLGRANALGSQMGNVGSNMGNFLTQNASNIWGNTGYNYGAVPAAGYGGWGGADYLAGAAPAMDASWAMMAL